MTIQPLRTSSDTPELPRFSELVTDIRRDPSSLRTVEAISAHSGIDATRLHDLFTSHYQATPAAYLNRVRLGVATRQLADPAHRIADVSHEAGFGDESAFRQMFAAEFGVSPESYQALGQDAEYSLNLPTDYLPWVALRVWGRDAESLTERVDGHTITKAITVREAASTDTVIPVRLTLTLNPGGARCRVESDHALNTPAMHQVHAAALRILGLANASTSTPAAFEQFVAGSETPRLIEGRQGLRIPQTADLFEGITWAIVGQQINLAFAYKLRRVLITLCDQAAPTHFRVHGLIAQPTPHAVAQLDYADLTQHQFSRRKAEYLIDTARLLASGALQIDPLESATQIGSQLMAVRGLGRWSVNYILMRSLGFADCVPVGDTGITTALQRFFELPERPDAEATIRLMHAFAPYRSFASYHLWMTLGGIPA